MAKGGKREGAGRPKGSGNKVTQEIRKKFEQLLNDNLDNINNDLVSIKNPKDRLDILIKMSEFVLPKLQRTSMDLEGSLDLNNVKIIRPKEK